MRRLLAGLALVLAMPAASAAAATILEFPIPTKSSRAITIAPGPDGAMWFAEAAGNKIGRITTAGEVTEFTVPTPDSAPGQINPGADGAMWFTEQ